MMGTISTDLTPRAITVLVSLRAGARGRANISDVLCDKTVQETESILTELRDLGLVQSMAPQFPRTWCLTYAGLGWLHDNGLDATDRAKREIADRWSVTMDKLSPAKPHHAGRQAIPVLSVPKEDK